MENRRERAARIGAGPGGFDIAEPDGLRGTIAVDAALGWPSAGRAVR
jgi:hypothetical protein